MAKLDDFGRPIYETAEEYNRAHKGGVCPRPYDSPEGENYQKKQSAAQRHSLQEGRYKAKVIIGGVIGVFAIIYLFIIGVMMINMAAESPGSSYEENWEENIMETEYFGTDEVPLPEDFDLFSYNGEFYRIPTDYWKISQMGFELEEYTEGDCFPAEYEEMLDLYDEDGYMRAMIRINNHTETEIPLEECMVDYIYIENPVIFDDAEVLPDFVFGDGLTFESSYEEVEAYLGTPYYHYADHSEEGYYYDQYQWSYYKEADWMTNEPDEIHFMQITFYNDVIESVSIEKKVYEEK